MSRGRAALPGQQRQQPTCPLCKAVSVSVAAPPAPGPPSTAMQIEVGDPSRVQARRQRPQRSVGFFMRALILRIGSRRVHPMVTLHEVNDSNEGGGVSLASLA